MRTGDVAADAQPPKGNAYPKGVLRQVKQELAW